METLEIEQRQTQDRVGTLPLLSVIDLVTETPSSDCFWNIHCLKHIPLTDRMLSWDLQSNKQEPLHDCPILRLPPWRWREGTGWRCECNPLSECWHVEPHPSPPPSSVLLIVIVFQTLPSVPQPSASGLQIIPGPILILISPFPIQGESSLTIHRGATPRD